MNFKGTRRQRLAREGRVDSLERVTFAHNSTVGRNELNIKKVELNQQMDSKIKDLVSYLNPELVNPLFERIEEEGLTVRRDPTYRLMKICEICGQMGVSTSKLVWKISIEGLKDHIKANTNPNDYYSGGAEE